MDPTARLIFGNVFEGCNHRCCTVVPCPPKRTIGKSQLCAISCTPEMIESIFYPEKTIKGQLEGLRWNGCHFKIWGGFHAIHAPNATFLETDLSPHSRLVNVDDICIDCIEADSVVVWSFLVLRLCLCLQRAKTARLKNPCISDSNTAKLVVINHLVLGPGCKWVSCETSFQFVWHWFVRYLGEQEAVVSHKRNN